MNRLLASRLSLCVLLGLTLAGCAPPSDKPPAGLVVEEHPLAGPPALDPLTFSPLEGTQASVLARHAEARARGFPVTVEFVGPDPEITSIGESAEWKARLTTSKQAPPEQVVTVERGGQEVFSASAGMPSPILPLQGLWTYSGHWALELVDTTADEWQGQVFVDGQLINDAGAYDEAFSFQILDGKPFFLFSRAGRLGYSYDGVEVELDYDRVPHYHCCSESVLNPVQAESMVAFFAQRGEDWFYVEIGQFGE
jgi:hypothetical protein